MESQNLDVNNTCGKGLGNEADEKSRRLRLKSRVLNEIISSEESYIAQLDLLLNGFIRPIKEKSLLPKSYFSAIFGDIEPLYSLNVTLHQELLKQETTVGTSFLKFAPYLKLYSTYANDYELALRNLQSLRKSNKQFELFISQQERLPNISRKLEALLIVPIQRVPRYRLLLSELISHTSETDEDHPILCDALKQIEAVAVHINEQIREQENMQMMIRIQRSLAHGRPKIVIPGRRFIKEGKLKKVSSDGDSAHERYFLLFNDMLLYCKIRSTSGLIQKGSLLCTFVLPLRHCVAEAIVGDGLFKVTCREDSLLLCAETAEEGKQWIEAVNNAADQLERNLSTLRKESSKRKPLRKRQLERSDDNLAEINNPVRIVRKNSDNVPKIDVEVLKPTPDDLPPIPKTPRSSKLLKWPGSCPGTPTFPYSPKKLLSLMTPSANGANHEVLPMFYSPPIQTDL